MVDSLNVGNGGLPPTKGGGVRGASLARLCLYLRELRRMEQEGIASTSSSVLGARLGVSDAIVRRDLAALGALGRRGVGYDVIGLAGCIRTALGADKAWNVALIGAGSLGTALLKFRGFADQGFRWVAAFDVRTDRIGEAISGVPVFDFAELESRIASFQIRLAVLAVPADAAREVAERLKRGGIAGILNFAPLNLNLGGETCVANVDLASELLQLSFAVIQKQGSEA